MLKSSTRGEIRQFHVLVVHDEKEMYQKRDPRAESLFCQSKPIAFLTFSLPSFSLPSLSSLPKLLSIKDGGLQLPNAFTNFKIKYF